MDNSLNFDFLAESAADTPYDEYGVLLAMKPNIANIILDVLSDSIRDYTTKDEIKTLFRSMKTEIQDALDEYAKAERYNELMELPKDELVAMILELEEAAGR